MKNELARTLFLARELSIDSIVACIGEKPEISAVYTDPGGRAAERIAGNRNESGEPGEGVIYYDIRFVVYIPQKKESVRMLINLEAQKSFYPGYEIVTRGIYYAARMISDQFGTEFSVPDYDGLKKVCSIWLCMNAPQYIGNAVTSYYLSRSAIEGWQPDRPEAYDKMEICIVTLNENAAADSAFLQMLNVLLSTEKSYEEKEWLLKEKFHIKMDTGLREELNLMCNLSEYVYEKGEKSGLKRGIKRGVRRGLKRGRKVGREEGREEIKRGVVKAMIKEGYPEASILRIACVTPEEYKKWAAEKPD